MADPTIIAHDTIVSGRVQGDGDLIVQGHVDGTVELSETLTVGADGRVDGEVDARQVVIEGRFQGSISAQERVILAATAQAVADIRAPIVEMADGASLRGELTVGVDAETATAARGGASTSTSRRRGASTTATRSSSTATSRRPTSARPTRGASPASPASTARAAESSATTTTTVVVEEETSKADESSKPDTSKEPDEPEGDVETEEEESNSQEPSLSEDTIQQYRRDFTVKELRDKLRDLELRVSGTKDELIERLLLAKQ